MQLTLVASSRHRSHSCMYVFTLRQGHFRVIESLFIHTMVAYHSAHAPRTMVTTYHIHSWSQHTTYITHPAHAPVLVQARAGMKTQSNSILSCSPPPCPSTSPEKASVASPLTTVRSCTREYPRSPISPSVPSPSPRPRSTSLRSRRSGKRYVRVASL